MIVISEANESVLTILKLFLKKEVGTRWSQYCVHKTVLDGVLVFNLLTRELVLLTKDEYKNFAELDYLKERWFVVPEGVREKEMADFTKLVLSTRQPESKKITDYTIFTTTDCNARCFYCFELGRSRIPMSCETAKKAVRYIKEHCGGSKVNIGWFGGEPLFNVEAIDTIAHGLHNEGIDFTSKMVSNGYLFNEKIVQKAVESWKLKSVQITLDGTEKIYNKVKAYIYRDTNPFRIVLNNISRLLEANIRVSIRLNMDLYNADDLLTLSEELAQLFSGRKGISVYAHHLFKNGTPDAELHSEMEWMKRDTAMNRLNETLEMNGLLANNGISKNIKLNHCMADSGKAITILPDGNIGLCEHYTESEFCSHLDRTDFDATIVKSWKERVPEIPECAECFYYMDCIKLKKCSSSRICYQQFRQEKLNSIQRAMLCEYAHWQGKTKTEDNSSDIFC